MIVILQSCTLIALMWQVPACWLGASSCIMGLTTSSGASSNHTLLSTPTHRADDSSYNQHSNNSLANAVSEPPNTPQVSDVTPTDIAIDVKPISQVPRQAASHSYYFNSNNEWVGYRNDDNTTASPTTSTNGSSSDDIIHINSADITQLMTLSGIGESKAKAIIAHRQTHGNFNDINALAQVKGIGAKTIQKNAHRLAL